MNGIVDRMDFCGDALSIELDMSGEAALLGAVADEMSWWEI